MKQRFSQHMRYYERSLILILMLFSASVMQAQNRTVKGTVSDAQGEPIIGANVVIVGGTKGVITDLDGKYSIQVPENGAVLKFSYIGFKTKSFNVVKGKNVLNVTLEEDAVMLEQTVVTAMDLRRDEKSLSTAFQKMDVESMTENRDAGFVNMLAVKVAGLQVISNGAAGSATVRIRGANSISGNNQPLYVIDGVPIINDVTGGEIDYGNPANSINPDDIETISVLKGPNAAALYGSRAGNGVILITTKKGSKKEGFGVRYSGNFTWSTVAETLKMQERYGQGTDGVYNKAASSSWGSELDGHMVEAWNGEQRAYSKYGNKLEDYFNTGFAHNHNVSISNVTDKSHFRASFGSSNNKGLFPNEKLDKINIDLNAGAEMNQYLSMEGKVSLSRTKAEDRPYFGSYGVIAQLIGIPHNVSLDDLKNYSTGVQHIGIPTNDIDKTVEFYHKLGFETAFETVNEEANEKVVFLKLGTLVVETYENHAAKMEHGAIDHVALDVRDIEEIFRYINEAGLNSTQDTIHFLPFWENGVKFFTIEGPNKEKVEFSQYL